MKVHAELPPDLEGRCIVLGFNELSPEACSALIECLSETPNSDNSRVQYLKQLWDELTRES